MIHVYFKKMAHHKEWLGAFCDGLDAHKIKYKRLPFDKYEPSSTAVFWGMNHPRILSQHEGSFLLLERGHFQPRETFTSVGWNGLGRRGDYINKGVGDDRFQRYLSSCVRPWKTNPKGYILMLGQVPGDMSVSHYNLKREYENACTHLKTRFGREVFFRPHPLASNRGAPRNADNVCRGDFYKDLDGAYRFWTLNSTAAVEAVLYGIPGECQDIGAMARDVSYWANADWHGYPYPDRAQWLNELAYTSWTKEEIASGETWEHLSNGNENIPNRKR